MLSYDVVIIGAGPAGDNSGIYVTEKWFVMLYTGA